MLDESSLQFSGQLVANLERPNLQDVTGVVESGESRAKHDSNFARPRLAPEMDRFAPDCDRRVPVVLCEKISAAVRYRENQTDCFAFSGSGRASSCGLLATRHFIRKFDAKWAWRFPSGERTRHRRHARYVRSPESLGMLLCYFPHQKIGYVFAPDEKNFLL